jgi:hypothetical protein
MSRAQHELISEAFRGLADQMLMQVQGLNEHIQRMA